ncbi:Ig-like domain-containing protein [Acinetobacter schindleri]|uniref:hypothetical protein n=1 Tax=Acinetobacter schindleri TaxID=108981 RepID=UPI002DB8ACA4|nr:hypothetical protein [Acinetobacter schindleri]MEB5929824.1 hypothetical protein [Acinetobacter schindleri]
MTLLRNLKKLGVNTTLLATSISLVACGGGGSDGYYNNDASNGGNGGTTGGNTEENTSENNTAQVVDSIAVQSISDAEGNPITKVNDGSVVEFSVQILNKDKGGIEGKSVTLSIADAEKLNVTSENSTVTTTAGGYATFKLNIPKIANENGKVQLTTTVAGTTIQQTHTLNIFKTSQMQSEYEIKAQQGIVLNLPNGSATIAATVTDKNGGVKANQDVTLSLPSTMLGKFFISSGSSVKTNAQGQAEFTIKANTDLTADEIKQLTATSGELVFTLVDEHKAQKTVKGAITFKDVSQVVQKLEIIKEDKPVVAQGGKSVVKVRAKNSNDVPLANKKVQLLFTDLSDAYGVKLDQAEVETDAQGYATFTVTTNSSYPIALSQQGINIRAVYTDNNQEVFAQDTLTVITENTNSSDELALQRLEVQSSYKVNAKDDFVKITVKGINNKGEAATQGKVTLTLNAEAVSNAVKFDEAATQEFKDGYVSYTLRTGAKTQAAVDALVAAGITATFTTDNSISTNVKIAVEDEAKSEEAVGYILVDPINTAFDYTKEQSIAVKVKAVGVKGSALKGETVSVALPKLDVSDLQALGLSLSGSSSSLTQEDGYARFTYLYKPNGSTRQKELMTSGIRITATSESNSNASQTLTLNFKAPTDQTELDLDYFNVDMPGATVLSVGQEYSFNVTVDAKGTDAKALAGQRIGIGFSEAAISNGVSLVSGSSLVTNETGKAVFNVKVKANNVTELNNLIANGITVGLIAQRKDGSSYTVSKKIDVSQSPVIFQDLVSLDITETNSISVLGGETRVKVVAKDASGKVIPNTSLAIALSSLTRERVSLSDTVLTTNSKGEAEFTIVLAEGIYDPELAKKGITFAVVGTNLNNGDLLQQTRTIQVTVPDEALNLRLTAESKYIEFGATQKIQIAVKDEIGLNTGGVPVQLSLPKQVTDLGVFLDNESVVVSKDGNVVVNLNIPENLSQADKDALLALGNIVVTGAITKPNGQKLIAELTFTLKNFVNTNSLIITPDKGDLSITGDRTIVSVKLNDSNGNPVRNQLVKLSALNAATLIIGTPGSGHPTNTSEPQTILTDSNGNAFFSVEIDGSTVDGDLLIASGIELIAEHIDENGAVASNIYRLDAYRPTPASPSEPLPAQYNLRIEASKPAMNVKNDMADVTVTLLDRNGGGVADKYITLELQNFVLNGAVIVGPSGLTTNESGQATFRVKVDENARNANYSAITFDADELDLTARYTEEGYRDAQQISRILINNVADENPRASIVIGVNPTGIESSTDGVYYTKNLSVKVHDFDGKPLANQAVELSVIATTYTKGRYIWALAPVIGGDPAPKWIGPYEQYYTDNDPTKPIILNQAETCVADENGSAVTNTDVTPNTIVPVKVVSFLGKDEDKVATYTTDKEGKFDLTIRYPKIYAQWLNVQIGASSTVASLPFRTTYNLGLTSLSSDYSSDGTDGPNLNSPYGRSLACP